MRLVVFMIEKNIFKLDKHFFFRERGGDFVNVLHMLRQCVKRFDTSTELFLRNKSIMHGFYNKKTIIRSQRFNLFFFSKYFLMYKDLFFVKYPILLVYRNARVFYRQHIFKKLKRVWRKRWHFRRKVVRAVFLKKSKRKFKNLNLILLQLTVARVGSGNSCAKRKYSYFTAKMRYLFFVKMIDLRFVKFLKKTYYNSLVHRRSLNLINGAYALKLFHADLDFALFVDFKNFVLATVIGLLRASVVNSRYLTGRRHTQITTTGEFSRSDPLTTSGTVRAEFARIFGTRALLVNKKRLTKIQFKPGYSTFFRRLRWDYKQVNNIDLLYQKRLTHHIKRFKNVNNMENLRAHTLGLKLLLVFAHLFTTLAEASFAIAGGVVYINNNIVRVDGFQLQAGDMISFTVSYQTFSYFLYQRFMRYSLLQRGTRLFRKYKSLATYPGRWVVQQYGFLNKNLWKKLHLSNVYRLYYLFFDIPRYIEMDYATLSLVILYQPDSLQDFDYMIVRRTAITYIKMLNWKYIS